MKVTRNVIQDLIPVYLADEASPDTRALVEEFLASDAALAAEVAQAKSSAATKILAGGNVMALPKDHELQSLLNTRRELSQRSWMRGLAIAFTLMPFAFVFVGGHLRWMLLRDIPSAAMACWAAALGFWAGFAIHNHRLRGSGL